MTQNSVFTLCSKNSNKNTIIRKHEKIINKKLIRMLLSRLKLNKDRNKQDFVQNLYVCISIYLKNVVWMTTIWVRVSNFTQRANKMK